MEFSILLSLAVLHVNGDLRETIHLANKSATSTARAVAMNVSPGRGRLISYEHVIKASFICNMWHLSNQRCCGDPNMQEQQLKGN